MTRRAFTLIELMVVIGIVVILVAVTMPAVKAMTRGNGQKQAVNQIRAMLVSARATALSRHTMAGLIFFEDPSSTGASSCQVLIRSGDDGDTLTYFNTLAGEQAQALPLGVKVGCLDGNSIRSESTPVNGRARFVLFDSNGQIINKNGIVRDPSLTDAASAAWCLNATTANPSYGVSRPDVVIYDGAAMQAATDKGIIVDDTTRSTWISQNADVLMVNPYTGTLIEPQ